MWPDNRRVHGPRGQHQALAQVFGILVDGEALDDDDVFRLDAQLVGDDLRKDGVVALTLGGQAGVDIDLAGDGMDFHVAALVRTKACAFDVAADADAQIRPAPTTLAPDDRSAGHRFPVFLPDGIHVLYTASSGRPDAAARTASTSSRAAMSVFAPHRGGPSPARSAGRTSES